MRPQKVYLVMGVDDKLLGEADTLEDAVRGAEEIGYPDVIVDQTLTEGLGDGEFEDLSPNVPRTAEEAWSRCYRLPPTYAGQRIVQAAGEPLRIDANEVNDLSLAEATERLSRFLPVRRGRRVTSLEKPSLMAKWLFGSPNTKLDARNIAAKTAKAEKYLGRPIPQAVKDQLEGVTVYGLSMLPAATWFQGRATLQRLADGRTLAEWKRATRAPVINTCVGASAECTRSCLVYSGRNESDPYNVVAKAAKMTMFFSDPEAFARVLVENIHLLREKARRSGDPDKLFVRLNVFQDIPWELVFPELFEAFSDVHFYDYTKVAGRLAPRNYDLTYSFSGRNFDLTVDEIRRDQRLKSARSPERGPRRIAAVFRVLGKVTEQRGAGGERSYVSSPDDASALHRFPKYMEWGDLGDVPVVDGDLSDVRPYDPDRCIVGLNYKNPMRAVGDDVSRQILGEQAATGKGKTVEKVRRPLAFVIEAFRMQFKDERGERWEYFAMPVTPRQEPDTGAGVAPEPMDAQLVEADNGRTRVEARGNDQRLYLPVVSEAG